MRAEVCFEREESSRENYKVIRQADGTKRVRRNLRKPGKESRRKKKGRRGPERNLIKEIDHTVTLRPRVTIRESRRKRLE